MLAAAVRKGRQLVSDPVLRRWLLARALGRTETPPPFTPHRPPYLRLPVALSACPAVAAAPMGQGGHISFRVHGSSFQVDGAAPSLLFDQPCGDLETQLALHRFSWLSAGADPLTVAALWRAWFDRFLGSDDFWAWHPYTTTERAIALLDFMDAHYWPGGDAQAILARHVDAIQSRLEYFGEHHTGNHLANNGRGLAHLGLRLGDEAVAQAGLDILVQEARRIFLPSGVLREGSSHYHLLYALRYAEMAALAQGRPEADALAQVAGRALAVAGHLILPGGMPLVGDISPDIAPNAMTLPPFPALTDCEPLRRDGWLRHGAGEWQGLWHAAPEGWSHMPGHGHQDCGSFELHWRGQPVFVDPGRGAYGEDGEAAFYRSGAAHNGLLVDGSDPYPVNRPYYGEGFRRHVGGTPPSLSADDTGVTLSFRAVERHWRLGERLEITDRVAGKGRHQMERRLHTPFPVTVENGAALIHTPSGTLAVRGGAAPELETRTRWLAYGEGVPATALVWRQRAALPWQGSLIVEPV